jgi:hypothetical protein
MAGRRDAATNFGVCPFAYVWLDACGLVAYLAVLRGRYLKKCEPAGFRKLSRNKSGKG